jgi:DNA-binding MarR family transcriptional regulator
VLTSGAITHRVDTLARAGLVERISGGRDRRSTLVGLTDEGRAVADRAMAANLACEAAMAGLLAGEDRETLAALLKKLLDALEAEEAEIQ